MSFSPRHGLQSEWFLGLSIGVITMGGLDLTWLDETTTDSEFKKAVNAFMNANNDPVVAMENGIDNVFGKLIPILRRQMEHGVMWLEGTFPFIEFLLHRSSTSVKRNHRNNLISLLELYLCKQLLQENDQHVERCQQLLILIGSMEDAAFWSAIFYRYMEGCWDVLSRGLGIVKGAFHSSSPTSASFIPTGKSPLPPLCTYDQQLLENEQRLVFLTQLFTVYCSLLSHV